MNRVLLFCATLSASSCVSAPKAPAELIVGIWDCEVAGGSGGGPYRLELAPSGEMKQSVGGVWTLSGAQLDMSLEIAATYVVADQKLVGMSPSWKVHRLLVNGAEIPASEQSELKSLLDGFVRRRMSLTIQALDTRELVLADPEHSTLCKRQTKQKNAPVI